MYMYMYTYIHIYTHTRTGHTRNTHICGEREIIINSRNYIEKTLRIINFIVAQVSR